MIHITTYMHICTCLGCSQSDQWGSTRFTMYFCTSCWAGHKLHESPHRFMRIMMSHQTSLAWHRWHPHASIWGIDHHASRMTIMLLFYFLFPKNDWQLPSWQANRQPSIIHLKYNVELSYLDPKSRRTPCMMYICMSFSSCYQGPNHRSNLEFFRRGRDDVSQDISCLVSHAELPGSNRLDSYERLVGANLQQVRGWRLYLSLSALLKSNVLRTCNAPRLNILQDDQSAQIRGWQEKGVSA
jgi:hypothetical protein